MVDLIKLKYGSKVSGILITGDAMGNRGDLSQRDNASLYIQLMRGLKIANNQLKAKSNPTHENSRADVNYLLYHSKQEDSTFDFKVYKKCKGTIRDLKSVQCDAFGEILKKNRKDLSQQADRMDCLRYAIDTFLKPFILEHQKNNLNTNKNNIFAQQENERLMRAQIKQFNL